MGGLLLLIALCGIMAVASFLAGLVPLSISLSQSQLRMVSNVGVGILVGTSMVVIIPEGVGALVPPSAGGHAHSHFRRGPEPLSGVSARGPLGVELSDGVAAVSSSIKPRDAQVGLEGDDDTEGLGFSEEELGGSGHEHSHDESAMEEPPEAAHEEDAELPTFYIGFSMIAGFILMFLIDRVPKHAAASSQGAAVTREIRLDNLGVPSSRRQPDDEAERFLGSPAEGPTKSPATSTTTTTGLVIHAAADGIAMGASSSTSNARLGFVVFFAILIHKAPAAFGLASVLLSQGLSQRAARAHLLIFSLAAPFGALATWLLIALLGGSKMDGANGQWWTGMLLLFSAGTFLYVAVHAMQDNDHAHHDDAGMGGYSDLQGKGPGQQVRVRDTLMIVGGMLLPLLTQIGHHH